MVGVLREWRWGSGMFIAKRGPPSRNDALRWGSPWSSCCDMCTAEALACKSISKDSLSDSGGPSVAGRCFRRGGAAPAEDAGAPVDCRSTSSSPALTSSAPTRPARAQIRSPVSSVAPVFVLFCNIPANSPVCIPALGSCDRYKHQICSGCKDIKQFHWVHVNPIALPLILTVIITKMRKIEWCLHFLDPLNLLKTLLSIISNFHAYSLYKRKRSCVCFTGYRSGGALDLQLQLVEGKISAPRMGPDFSLRAAMLDLLVVIPIMINAFIYHFNVQPIYNELKEKTPRNMYNVGRKKMLALTGVLLALIYLGSTMIPNIWMAFKFTSATTCTT